MIEVGALLDGKITKIAAFGAFVALGDGKCGMIHISEVSSGFVRDIHDHLTEGQDVRVKVIGVDSNGRISLSLKQADQSECAPVEFESASKAPESFEDMMSRFKATSDDRINDLRQSVASKRGTPPKPRRRDR